MKGLLLRVGIDQAWWSWNAPVDPQTGTFAYVPIPDQEQMPGLETPYHSLSDELAHFPGAALSARLPGQAVAPGPDFAPDLRDTRSTVGTVQTTREGATASVDQARPIGE